MNEYAKLLSERPGRDPEGLGSEFWLAPRLPYTLRERIESVFEILSHLPLEQPLAVVADVGKTAAVNAPLLRLLGGASPDLVGQMWSRVMPGWPERARGFRREGEQIFEEHLLGAGGESVWVRVSLGPLAERGEERAMAYTLFINRPDVETVDHDEVRRLRKSLELFADTHTDYVVEVDRDGVMTFVSPSFCRVLGATEAELVGRAFDSRVLEQDRPSVAAGLAQALTPPFSGTMSARLAVEPGAPVEWQVDAVVGDGIVGLDLVGRPGAGGAAVPAGGQAPGGLVAPARDARLATIEEKLGALRPGDPESFYALASAVGQAAGVDCVPCAAPGDGAGPALGWRLPPA